MRAGSCAKVGRTSEDKSKHVAAGEGLQAGIFGFQRNHSDPCKEMLKLGYRERSLGGGLVGSHCLAQEHFGRNRKLSQKWGSGRKSLPSEGQFRFVGK